MHAKSQGKFCRVDEDWGCQSVERLSSLERLVGSGGHWLYGIWVLGVDCGGLSAGLGVDGTVHGKLWCAIGSWIY